MKGEGKGAIMVIEREFHLRTIPGKMIRWDQIGRGNITVIPKEALQQFVFHHELRRVVRNLPRRT
jgi:hypothetical protein